MAKTAKESANEKEQEDEKIFEEWQEKDLNGKLFIIRPWPLSKGRRAHKIVGKIMESVRQTVGEDGLGFEQILNEYFFSHIDHFFQNQFDELCNLILLSADKEKTPDWLDHVDNALALRILDVIWKQNFTGPRVRRELERWIVPQSSANVQRPTDELVQAVNSLGDIS